MNNLARLKQIESHLAKAHDLLRVAMASEEGANTPIPGRPDPDVTQRVAWHIARRENWRHLTKLAEFTFRDVRELVKSDLYCSRRSDSTYSSILSKWARDGYLVIVSQGSGPSPTKYKVKKK